MEIAPAKSGASSPVRKLRVRNRRTCSRCMLRSSSAAAKPAVTPTSSASSLATECPVTCSGAMLQTAATPRSKVAPAPGTKPTNTARISRSRDLIAPRRNNQILWYFASPAAVDHNMLRDTARAPDSSSAVGPGSRAICSPVYKLSRADARRASPAALDVFIGGTAGWDVACGSTPHAQDHAPDVGHQPDAPDHQAVAMETVPQALIGAAHDRSGPRRMGQHEPERDLTGDGMEVCPVEAGAHQLHRARAGNIEAEADPERSDVPRQQVAPNMLRPHPHRIEDQRERDQGDSGELQAGHRGSWFQVEGLAGSARAWSAAT